MDYICPGDLVFKAGLPSTALEVTEVHFTIALLDDGSSHELSDLTLLELSSTHVAKFLFTEFGHKKLIKFQVKNSYTQRLRWLIKYLNNPLLVSEMLDTANAITCNWDNVELFAKEALERLDEVMFFNLPK